MTDTNMTSPAPAPRANRWLLIALTASLALNVAAIGWGAARYYKFREGMRSPVGMIEERIERRLPENAAKAFRAEMAETRKALGPVSFGAEREKLAEALRSEPFDSARLKSEFASQRARMDQFQRGMQGALVAAAEAMTPAERREFAEKMMRRARHHDERRREHRD